MTKQYLDAVRTVIDQGTRKPSRTWVDTISYFKIPMRFDLRDGFPLLTTKKVSWWNIVAENLWFLSGSKDISFLKRHNIKFWDDWADEDGRVPSAYGNFWRRFPVPGDEPYIDGDFNDQIAWAINELRKNPMSRRVCISAWAPGNAQTSKLPPCHAFWVLNVQNLQTIVESEAELDQRLAQVGVNKTLGQPTHDGQPTEPHLCLDLTQRSCDMFLGVPYNIAGYAFLTHLIGHLVGLPAGILGHSLVDAHIYTCKPDGTMGGAVGNDGKPITSSHDHMPQLKEQLTREPRRLPRLTIDPKIRELADVEALLDAPKDEILDIFKLEGYDPHPPLKGAVAV